MKKYKSLKDPHICKGCGVLNLVRRSALREKRLAGKEYRCSSCALRGDGVGSETPRAKDKIPTKCVGCGQMVSVLYDVLGRLKKRGRDYRCHTCAVRGDGVGSETPKVSERIPTECTGCRKTHHPKEAKLRRLKKAGRDYRCTTCNLRGDGVGSETPKASERIHTECAKCHKIVEVLWGNLKKLQNGSYHCLKCVTGGGASSPETELMNFIKNLDERLSPEQGNRTLLKPSHKEIDIFIPSEELGVEYNGNHWHSERVQKDKSYHFDKRLLAESNGIRLIQIRSDEWLYKRPIVESLLKTVLKKSENRYFARKLTIEEVPGKQAQKFLLENHLMGGYRSSRQLGLFTQEGTLAQLFSFKLLKNQTEMDCSRICSLRNCNVVGGVSRLLKAALRKHPSVQRAISFVDLRYADGHSLEKIGFVREKVTLGWGWTDGANWFNRLQCKADPKRGLTERESASLKGWYRLYDAGQAKYIMELKKDD